MKLASKLYIDPLPNLVSFKFQITKSKSFALLNNSCNMVEALTIGIIKSIYHSNPKNSI